MEIQFYLSLIHIFYSDSPYLKRDDSIYKVAGEVIAKHCLGEECPYFDGGINYTGESHQLRHAMCSGPFPLQKYLIAVLTVTPALSDPIELPFKRPCLDE